MKKIIDFNIDEFNKYTKISEIIEYIKISKIKEYGTKMPKVNMLQGKAIKDKILEYIITTLEEEAGIIATKTVDGYVLELENEELGVLYLNLNLVLKNLNYDIYNAIMELEYKEEVLKK